MRAVGSVATGDRKEEADASITCLVPIIEYQSMSEDGWVIQSYSSSQSSSSASASYHQRSGPDMISSRQIR